MEPLRVRKVERDTNERPVVRPGMNVAANDTKNGAVTAFRPPAANDNLSFRNIDRQIEPTNRPRDAALRAQQAVRKTVVNDNGNNGRYPTVDQTFRNTYINQGVGPSILSSAQKNNPDTDPSNESAGPSSGTRSAFKTSVKGFKVRTPQQMALRALTHPGEARQAAQKAQQLIKAGTQTAKAVEVSISMASTWGWMVYLVQLIFAVVSIVALGMSGGFKAANDTWIGYILPNSLDPEPLFYIGMIVALVCGYITLFTAGFIYTSAGVPCLSGNRAGNKWMMLLLAFIGYSLPILNIFPWALGWFYAVSVSPALEALNPTDKGI